jgi:hypothetical protein
MNATSKKVNENRDNLRYLKMAEAFIKTAILTADDIWGVTEEDTKKFIHAYEEVVNGYGEEGLARLDEELAERGIEVVLKQ